MHLTRFRFGDVRLYAGSATGACSYPLPTMSQMPALPLDRFDTDRCSNTAFIEPGFFVWCTLIAQIILSTRHETVPFLTCTLHLIRPVGLQDLCHHCEERDRYRFLRVHNGLSVSLRDIHDDVGCEGPRYDIHICG